MTLTDRLPELRELLDGMTVECGCHPGNSKCRCGGRHYEDCAYGCHGTGRIPDPAAAPLLEVVRVGVLAHMLSRAFDNPPRIACKKCAALWYEGDPDMLKADCPIADYTLRDWSGMPEGALAGALILALMRTKVLDLECKAGELADWLGLGYESSNDVFLDAVLEAVRAMKVTA